MYKYVDYRLDPEVTQLYLQRAHGILIKRDMRWGDWFWGVTRCWGGGSITEACDGSGYELTCCYLTIT